MQYIFWKWYSAVDRTHEKFCAVCGQKIPRGMEHYMGYGTNADEKEYVCTVHMECLGIYDFLCKVNHDFHDITETQLEAVNYVFDETGQYKSATEALRYIQVLILNIDRGNILRSWIEVRFLNDILKKEEEL